MKMTPRTWLMGMATCSLLAIVTVMDTHQPTTPLRAAPEVTPLDRVPADAAVFAHFLAGDLWNHPALVDVRKSMAKDVAPLLKQAEELVGLNPADYDSITFYYPKFPENPEDGQLFVVQVTAKKPLDKNKILVPARVTKDPVQKDGSVKLQDATVLLFTGDRQFSVMHESLVPDFNKGASKVKEGPAAHALQVAKEGKSNFVFSINPETLPADLFANAPDEVKPFLPLLKSKAITLHGSIGSEIKAHVRFQSHKMDLAIDNERSFDLLMKVARDNLDVVLKDEKSEEVKILGPMLRNLVAALKEVKTTRQDNTVSAAFSMKADDKIAMPLAKLLIKPGQANARAVSSNNLKQIGLAMHNYAAVQNDVFPAASICDKKGKPLLSWRVSILPYLEQQALYNQFKLDEPWDSEHNLKLSKVVVKTYQLPGGDAKPGETNYRVFIGNETAFDYVQGRRLPADFPDGTSNTILVYESTEAVVWTKPDEVEFNPKKPIAPHLRFREGDVCMFLFADGSVRAIQKKISEETLSHLIQRNDGQAIGKDGQ